MRALCWEDCLWMLLSQGPAALSGFYQEYWWGRGHRRLNPGSSACGFVPTQQVRLGQIIQYLFWNIGTVVTWPGFPALCSQCPGSRGALISLLLRAQERMQSWRGWLGDGRGMGSQSQAVKNFTPEGQGLLWLLLWLGLQFTNEIKMPGACLYTFT